MSSPYVCITCRQALSHLRRNKSFQWHSKATFNSLISTPPSSTSEQYKQDGAASTRGFQGGETRNRPKLPRRPPATRYATREPADALESMFEDTLKQQSIRQPTRTSVLSQRTSSTVKAYQDGEQLKEMLRAECPLNDCWSFFVEHFGPTAWKNGTISRNSWPVYLKSTVPRMLRLIRDQRNEQPLRNDVPTFSEMILVTFELGLLRGTQWVQMITKLIESIIAAGVTTAEGQKLLSELLKCWNIVCRRRPRRLQSQELINKSDPEVTPSCSDWSNLPSHSLHSIFLEKRQNGTQYAFGLLTPQFAPGEMYQLPTIALGTLKLLLELEKTEIGSSTIVEDAKPLMLKFSNTVNACSMSLIDAAEFFRDVPESVVNLVKGDWPTIKEFTEKENVRKDFKVTENLRTQALHKRVIDAHARRDVASLDRLWSQVQQLPIYIPNAKDGFESGYRTGYLTPAFYNLFILLFMNLKQQPRAIEVWNHMIGNNLTPNLGAWDAMLNGCKNSRDAKALEQVWAMMISSGEKPDVTCWTTRISGLIHCYQPEAGIRALDEMGRLWLAAARKKYPNLKIENSKKLSGLIKRQEIKAADRILAWADQWGIIPDVQTYNTLLSSIVRAGHSDKTPEILTSMEGHGVQADAATFVTILDQTFAGIETLSPAEQIEAINNTFLTMEQMKVTPNQFLYEVMNRMATQGLTPSTYIYTILLEYYFAQSPPNFQAATTLIERAQLTVGTVDHIFWDRLIEGYASVGDTDTAISYLRNVQKSKQFTSWNTMRTLLMALVEKDEWGVATELVNNAVKDTGGPIGAEEKGVEGQHKFWELVRELRILD
ncbi:glutathione S-transferase [Botrytis cinerea]